MAESGKPAGSAMRFSVVGGSWALAIQVSANSYSGRSRIALQPSSSVTNRISALRINHPWTSCQRIDNEMVKISPMKRRQAQPKSPEVKGNHRLFYLAAFLGLWLTAICGRLVWLQLVDYGDLTQRANKQQQRSIEVSPVRGNIFDRNGNELAMTVSVDSI